MKNKLEELKNVVSDLVCLGFDVFGAYKLEEDADYVEELNEKAKLLFKELEELVEDKTNV